MIHRQLNRWVLYWKIAAIENARPQEKPRRRAFLGDCGGGRRGSRLSAHIFRVLRVAGKRSACETADVEMSATTPATKNWAQLRGLPDMLHWLVCELLDWCSGKLREKQEC